MSETRLEKLKIVSKYMKIYKETRNNKDFINILKIVDKLILYLIIRLRRKYSFLNNVESKDLYQIGILGLHYAIISMPDNELPSMIPARIKAYIYAQLRKVYFNKDREISVADVKDFNIGRSGDKYIQKILDQEKEVINRMMFRLEYYNYLKTGEITEEEDKIVNLRFIHEADILKIADELNISPRWAYEKIKRVQAKLRKLFKIWR